MQTDQSFSEQRALEDQVEKLRERLLLELSDEGESELIQFESPQVIQDAGV